MALAGSTSATRREISNRIIESYTSHSLTLLSCDYLVSLYCRLHPTTNICQIKLYLDLF